MDPITVTATFITLATFIKDLIEVGESIHRSIEKVGENRRQIRELTEEVVRTLYDLANLTQGREETFQGSELLSALENLKAEMLHVHSKCLKITPIQLPGLRGIGSQLKAWRKRDDLEGKIGRLKECVNKCYRQFIAFSAARIEQTTLRIEQALIVTNVENQVKARRLEGMMAQLLLETEFGQNKMNQTIEIISADPTHESLESQYLSAQTMCLVDSVQQLLIGGKLVLHEPLADPTQPFQLVFLDTRPTLHVLHWILGTVIKIHESTTVYIPLEHIADIFSSLGGHLSKIGMTSESIAWERLKLQVLLSLDDAAAISPDIAHALDSISSGYHQQSQFQAALQASQKSLDLWHHISECLPDVDNRIGLLTTLVTHAQNLLETGQKMAALSTAQNAAAISLSMAEQLINSSSGLSSLNEADEYNAVRCCDTLFTLAQALASLDRHLEAYEAFKEGFQTFLSLPICKYPPSGKDIDSFINTICKVAEGGWFSLAMLADCVDLFRDLAHICPEQFSTQFLWFLHAYAYYTQQINSLGMSPSMDNIRVFLEPKFDSPPPNLDITRCMDLNALHGTVIEDAVRAFHIASYGLPVTFPLIRNIFVTHFNQAIIVLRDVLEKSPFNTTTLCRILCIINSVLLVVSDSNQVALRQFLLSAIKNFRPLPSQVDAVFLAIIYQEAWKAGLFDEALGICEQVLEYLDTSFDTDSSNASNLRLRRPLRLNRVSLLHDMGRVPDAIKEMQRIEMMPQLPPDESLRWCNFCMLCIIQIHILRCTGRNQEALQLLKRGVAKGGDRLNSEVFDTHLHFLIVELAATWGIVGRRETALEVAEKAVEACRKGMADKYMEDQKGVLIHSLTTLSNCLATIGKNDQALKMAQEAASIYTHNVVNMWQVFLYAIRREELGAKAFQALSQRLNTSGELDQALVNSEKATKLFRQLVVLSPRHLPALASSLQNLASILWKIGHQDEAIAACIEAVDIMRKVVDTETYFLPALAEALSQISVYLKEKGDNDGMFSATAECTEARRQFAVLPPQLEFLFEKVEMEEDDEDEGIKEWETASEAEEKYNNDLDTAINIVSSTACASISELPLPAPTPNEWETASEGECDDELDAATSVGAQLSGTVCASISKLPSPVQTLDCPLQSGMAEDTVSLGGMDKGAMSPVTEESPTTTEIAFSAKSLLTDILSKPIEVRVSMRSTPMDILWWILLCFMGMALLVLSVAFAVL